MVSENGCRMKPITGVALGEAKKVLHRCRHERGFNASAPLGSQRGYHGVWARDCVITCLGASLLNDVELQTGLVDSLRTLRQVQRPNGHIPVNVLADTGQPGKRGLPGPIDGNLWYVLGCWYAHTTAPDDEFLSEAWPSVGSAMQWLQCHDLNDTGLLHAAESSNWMDIFGQHGNVLYDNALYYACHRAMARMAEHLGEDGDGYDRAAERTAERFELRFWVDEQEESGPRGEVSEQWGREFEIVRGLCGSRPYFLPWLDFHSFGTYLDVLGNLLAILLGLADRGGHTDPILDFINRSRLDQPFPGRAIYPLVQPGDLAWREYYRRGGLNLPHCYHNGGIWPFIGGFQVAALVCGGRIEEAETALVALAELNKLGRFTTWEFNEWFNGETYAPLGLPYQAWSAGMYVFAYEAVSRRQVPVLPRLNPAHTEA